MAASGKIPEVDEAYGSYLLRGSWGRGWRLALLVLIALGIGVLLRSYHLSADPPLRLSWSQAPVTDGARVVESARNRILFGEWVTDPNNPTVAHFPLTSLLAFAIFRVVGVGIWQAGLLSVICGVISLLSMAALLLRWTNPPAAVWGTFLMATNYQLVMYDRLPMAESMMICLMTVATWVLVEGMERSRGRLWFLAGAGILVGTAGFLVKLHALILLPVGCLVIWGTRPRVEVGPLHWRRWGILLFAGGVLVVGLFWLLAFYTMYPEAVTRYLQSNVTGHYHYSAGEEGREILSSLGKFIRKRTQGLFAFGVNVTFLYRTALSAMLALLMVIRFLAGFPRRLREESPARGSLLLWLTIGLLAISLLDYRPLRYHILLLPPICALAGVGLAELLAGSGRWRPAPLRGRIPFLVLVAGFFLGYQIVGEGGRLLVFHHRKIYRFLTGLRLDGDQIMNAVGRLTQGFAKPTLTAATVAVVGLIIYALLSRHWRRGEGAFLSPGWRESIALFLVFASVAIDLGHYLPWALSPRYTIQEAGRDLGEILSPGAVIMGDAATALCLENTHRTVPNYGDLMIRGEVERLKEYPVTHVLYRRARLQPFVEKNMEEVVATEVFVRSYTVAGDGAELWRVPDWPGAATAEPYEPTEFEQGIALLQEGRYEEAAPLFERFLARYPRNGNACIVLGACYSEMGREDETLALFERAARLRPHDAVILEDLGDLYVARGEEKKAEEAWTRSLELEPRNEELTRRLVQLRGYGLEGFTVERGDEEESSAPGEVGSPLFGGDEER